MEPEIILPTWTLAASNDSITWTNIVAFTGPPLHAMDAPAVGVFNAVTAKWYWLTQAVLHGLPGSS